MDYSAQLTASGGPNPYSWSVSDLPPGLQLSSDGSITGVPTTSGGYPFTATVTDAEGTQAAASLAIYVE
jgi:hypothetical protein